MNTVKVVNPDHEILSKQNLPYFVGISAASGATGISMNIVIIPAQSAAEPHLHRGFESAIYMLRGSTEVHYGVNLEEKLTLEEGSFLYIPAGLPHQPINHSDEPVIAIVARNTADEQESVELFNKIYEENS